MSYVSQPDFVKLSVVDPGHLLYRTIVDECNPEEGFNILQIMSVNNTNRQSHFDELMGTIEHSNIQILYHTTSDVNIRNIIVEGLDTKFAKPGFFGKGIYLSDSPLKANDYSQYKGNPTAKRYILRCKVILGNTNEFPTGRFDRALTQAPAGFHSVKGFIRHNYEYAVYNPSQVVITEVISYTFSKTSKETEHQLTIPSDQANSKIVFVTSNLSQYFGNLETKAVSINANYKGPIKSFIGLLLKREITPSQFVSLCEILLKAIAPIKLIEQLTAELAKCNLDIDVSTLQVAPLPKPSQFVTAAIPAKVAAQQTASAPVTPQAAKPASAAADSADAHSFLPSLNQKETLMPGVLASRKPISNSGNITPNMVTLGANPFYPPSRNHPVRVVHGPSREEARKDNSNVPSVYLREIVRESFLADETQCTLTRQNGINLELEYELEKHANQTQASKRRKSE
jgi:hypothetical protein